MICDIVESDNCCGCSACFHSCPANAITMEENGDGFFNAVIDRDKCVNCGICDKACPVQHQTTTDNIRCYAMKLCEETQLMKSQSGGAFYSIAQRTLADGGVVYGVSNSNISDVCVVRVDSIEQLTQLLKSKYVQSNSGDSFAKVKEDLQNGRKVFYSGTACLVQGLKNYLHIKNVSITDLLTCDLICHGVPSRKMDRDYISYMEKKEDSKVVSLIYRNKERGWGSHFEKYTFANGKTKETNDKVIVFSKGYALSPACFNCKFTTPYRKADITIGDFWSLQRIGMSKKQFLSGVSVCIVRNKYLEQLIQDLSQEKVIQLTEIELEDAMQWNLQNPSVKPNKYKKFWKMYRKNRFHSLKPVYFSLSLKEKVSRMAKWVLKKL